MGNYDRNTVPATALVLFIPGMEELKSDQRLIRPPLRQIDNLDRSSKVQPIRPIWGAITAGECIRRPNGGGPGNFDIIQALGCDAGGKPHKLFSFFPTSINSFISEVILI